MRLRRDGSELGSTTWSEIADDVADSAPLQAQVEAPEDATSTVTVTSLVEAWLILSDDTYVEGTASSHTVCQMPDDGVYVSPPGLSMAEMRCLPLGCAPLSEGSAARRAARIRHRTEIRDVGGGCGARV